MNVIARHAAAILAFAAATASAPAPQARADEIDDALALFATDGGLTAAEKLPALKAFIEEHADDPRAVALASVMELLAEEAGDKAARKWAGEMTEKLGKPAATSAAPAAKSPAPAAPRPHPRLHLLRNPAVPQSRSPLRNPRHPTSRRPTRSAKRRSPSFRR